MHMNGFGIGIASCGNANSDSFTMDRRVAAGTRKSNAVHKIDDKKYAYCEY